MNYKTKLLLSIIATGLSVGNPAIAAEVEMKDGRRIEAQEITYNGATNQFVVNKQGTRLPLSASDIKQVIVRENLPGHIPEMQQLAAEKDNLAKENEKIQADLAAANAKIQELNKANQEQNTRIASMSLQQTDSSLTQALQKMREENARLQGRVKLLEDEKAMAKMSGAGKTSAPIALPKAVNVTWENSRTPGFMEVKGLLENETDTAFADVVVEVSATDQSGNVLGMNSTFVSNLGPREKSPFQADVEADAGKIANKSIRLVPIVSASNR